MLYPIELHNHFPSWEHKGKEAFLGYHNFGLTFFVTPW